MMSGGGGGGIIFGEYLPPVRIAHVLTVGKVPLFDNVINAWSCMFV